MRAAASTQVGHLHEREVAAVVHRCDAGGELLVRELAAELLSKVAFQVVHFRGGLLQLICARTAVPTLSEQCLRREIGGPFSAV